MKLESLNSLRFKAMDKPAMAFIVGGGNSVSVAGTYNGVKASNDYVDCDGKVFIGSHEGADFTAQETKNLEAVECPTTKVAK